VTESNSPEQQPEQRSRWAEFMVKLFGPAQVEGAIQGHSPEARDAWKRRVAARRAEREGRRSRE
jgi:hypothetical protein